MKHDLFKEVEKLLDEETERIVNKIIGLYNEKKIVNKSFSALVRSFLNKDLKYYATEIELRAYGLLPNEYAPDPQEKYALISKEEYKMNHLISYSKWCRSSRQDKDHIKAAKGMAKIFIKDYITNKNIPKNILELVANNMDMFFPKHNDSVDARAVILYLQTEIEDMGYKVVSSAPLKLSKLN